MSEANTSRWLLRRRRAALAAVLACGADGARCAGGHSALRAAGSGLVFRTLVADWAMLSDCSLVTLLTTLQGFVLAVVGGVGLAVLFNQSRLIEYSLYPYAVILQVDADRGDRAAAAGVAAAAGGGARLRLDRRVLSSARQHHARAELGRSQPRRPVPPLRRVAARQVLWGLKLPARCPTSWAD